MAGVTFEKMLPMVDPRRARMVMTTMATSTMVMAMTIPLGPSIL